MSVRLYHLDDCSHCAMVRLAMRVEGLPCATTKIDAADREPLRRISGQDRVPVLVLEEGTVLSGAARILRWLTSRAGSRLLPEGRRDQALAWMLVDRADSVLAPLHRALVTGEAEAGSVLEGLRLSQARERLEQELASLEVMLDRGPFLFGSHPSVADVALHAFLGRIRDFTGEGDRERFPRVVAWYERLLVIATAAS